MYKDENRQALAMTPQIDQSIIAGMQRGRKPAIYRVILLAGLAVVLGSALIGSKQVFLYSAPSYLIVFIVIYVASTRKPTCSLCGGNLHSVNRRISGDELKRIYSDPNAPAHLRMGEFLIDRNRPNQWIQGYECYHCRKMAILA